MNYVKTGLAIISLMVALPTQANSNHPYPEKPLTADQIVHEAYLVQHGMHMKNSIVRKTNGKVAMVLNRMPNKNVSVNILEASFKNDFNDGKTESKSLAIMKSGRLRGTGILMTHYINNHRKPSISLWLPSLRKVRRMSVPNHADKWMGTNMTYGDVYLRKPEHEVHELLGMKTFADCLGSMMLKDSEKTKTTKDLPESSCRPKGKEVYQLKSTTKFKDWWYDYHLTDIDTQTFAAYRTVYFKGGKQIKTIEVDWVSLNQIDPRKLVPSYIYAKSIESGQESMLIIPFETIKLNTNLPARYWSEKTLRKIKR